MELVTEMLFLPEQFSFIGYVFAVNFHVFQYWPSLCPASALKNK